MIRNFNYSYEKTAHGSNRLWIKRKVIQNVTTLSMLSACLGAMSIWGGADAKDDELLSWEFDKEVTEKLINQVLNRFGITNNVETPEMA